MLAIATFKIVVDIMSDESCFELASVTNGVGRTGNIQIFGKNKFDAANGYITAGLPCVCGNRQGFHATFMLASLAIHLA